MHSFAKYIKAFRNTEKKFTKKCTYPHSGLVPLAVLSCGVTTTGIGIISCLMFINNIT